MAHWSIRRDPFPRILRIVTSAHHWVFAIIRAHAIAQQDDEAASLICGLELELATILGEPPPDWPSFSARSPGWCHSGAAPPELDPRTMPLPSLDPTQHLLLTSGLEKASAPVRDANAILLEAAFGPDRFEWHAGSPDPSHLDDEIRIGALGHLLPEPSRGRWLDAMGLSPPPLFGAHLRNEATELIAAAFPDEMRSEHVAFCTGGAIGHAAAIDLVMSALAVRAALRATGTVAISRSGAIATAA